MESDGKRTKSFQFEWFLCAISVNYAHTHKHKCRQMKFLFDCCAYVHRDTWAAHSYSNSTHRFKTSEATVVAAFFMSLHRCGPFYLCVCTIQINPYSDLHANQSHQIDFCAHEFNVSNERAYVSPKSVDCWCCR